MKDPVTANSNATASVGGCGCVSTILGLIVIWALIFGVTWNGVYHGINCSCSKGVEVK